MLSRLCGASSRPVSTKQSNSKTAPQKHWGAVLFRSSLNFYAQLCTHCKSGCYAAVRRVRLAVLVAASDAALKVASVAACIFFSATSAACLAALFMLS